MKIEKTTLETTSDDYGKKTTTIDATTKYKDYNHTTQDKNSNKQTMIIKSYCEDGMSDIFEINGITLSGQHLQLLRDFINNI